MTFLTVKNTSKITIKILRGSAVTQNVLDESIMYEMYKLFVNFLHCTSVKNDENRFTYVKVMS